MTSPVLPFGSLRVDQRIALEDPHNDTWRYGHIASLSRFGGTAVMDDGERLELSKYDRNQPKVFDAEHPLFIEANAMGEAYEILEGLYHSRHQQLRNPVVREALTTLAAQLDPQALSRTRSMLRACGAGGKTLPAVTRFINQLVSAE